MSYVYIRSEPSLWTVGFYSPDGSWTPESDHESPTEAAQQVAQLNGGGYADGYRVGLERGAEVALMWFAPADARERAKTDIVRAELATHQD